MGRTRVSDIIKEEDIKAWTPGDTIIISAGTDTGKSFWVKNVLYQYAKERSKKILLLLHRRPCKDQFVLEVEEAKKTDVITIITYQHLEQNKSLLNLANFSYIVCDEWHYFLSDAKFNANTDISFRTIMDCKTAVKIFMSATGEDVERYIRHEETDDIKKYEIPLDWSFIGRLCFYHNDDSLQVFAREIIADNRKAIFFIDDKKLAYGLYKQFQDYAVFNCSKTDPSGYRKYVDEGSINEILRNQRFETNLLITTRCMDAGLNIIDPDLTTIVIDNTDLGSLIQCMGRKRRQSNMEKITVYIKAISNQQLAGMEQLAKRDLEKAKFLKEHGPEAYLQKYNRDFDKTGIVYDDPVGDGSGRSIKKVNEMMFHKRVLEGLRCRTMMALGRYGYCKYLAKQFDRYDPRNGYYDYELFNENHSLTSYLESVVDKVMLHVKDRKELVQMMDVRSNGRQLKSINSLNDALQELGIPFCIERCPTSKVVDGNQLKYRAACKVVRHTWTNPK